MQNIDITCQIEQTINEKKIDLRERILKKGARNLSDRELIALLLRTGTRDSSLLKISQRVLECIDKKNIEEMEKELRKLKGLGDSKISTVMAAFELGRRYYSQTHEKITEPSKILPYLKHYATRKTENFICVSLSGANEIINIRVISTGTLTSTLVHPREVFADVIVDRAASVIFAHNHPSGNVEPSSEDIELTYRLVDVADILGIEVLDHIIFSQRDNFVSLAELGIMENKSSIEDAF